MAEQVLDKQRPINSPLKSKRTVWREPENPIRWAYAKILREQSKNKKTYPVNPYAEVYQFRDNLYGIYTESLDGMGDPWIYLIVGPAQAMLIDTGFGAGNLKGLVEELIGNMPLIVVNTHAHFDHAYGNFAFDKVYCHEYEVPILTSKRNPHIWDYLFDENGRGRWADFDRADIVPFKEYEIAGVPDGHIFNLGEDYDVELVFLPGHSVGHAGYLDKKNRIFFAGDDACVGAVGVGGAASDAPYREYATVEALRNELVKIIKRTAEFDAVFPGHGPVDAGTIVLDNVLEACEAVLKDPQCYDVKTESVFNGVKRIQFGKLIYLSGYLRYNGKSLYMSREVEIT
jgi:glyoxylase-like metal-dependent hydrolase (beta-lactamase superfamily II)